MKQLLRILCGILLLSGCGGGDDPKPPTAATLLFPENNAECLDGEHVNATQSTVTFTWNGSGDTNEYRLTLKNLNSSDSPQTFSTTTNSYQATLTKGEPYSWFVTSVSNIFPDDPAVSPTWKFYVAGEGIENYAPFPAEITYPKSGESIALTNDSTTLHWEGEDIDNDISDYKVYLDTNNTPTTLAGTTGFNNLPITLQHGTIYYWYVVTTDSEGNTSDSGVFQFRTQ